MLKASKSPSPRWMLAYPSNFDPDVPRSCSTDAPLCPRLRMKEARAAAKRAEPRLAKELRRELDMSLWTEERRLSVVSSATLVLEARCVEVEAWGSAGVSVAVMIVSMM